MMKERDCERRHPTRQTAITNSARLEFETVRSHVSTQRSGPPPAKTYGQASDPSITSTQRVSDVWSACPAVFGTEIPLE